MMKYNKVDTPEDEAFDTPPITSVRSSAVPSPVPSDTESVDSDTITNTATADVEDSILREEEEIFREHKNYVAKDELSRHDSPAIARRKSSEGTGEDGKNDMFAEKYKVREANL